MDQADVVLLALGALGDEVVAVELHEEVDLGSGALPVFRTEAVEGEGVEAQAGAMGDHSPDGFGSAFVTADSGQASLAGPAPVAVHDDGYVARELTRLQAQVLLGIEGRLGHRYLRPHRSGDRGKG